MFNKRFILLTVIFFIIVTLVFLSKTFQNAWTGILASAFLAVICVLIQSFFNSFLYQEFKKIDIIFLIDKSGSMEEGYDNSGQTRIEAAKITAKKIINETDFDYRRIGIIVFGGRCKNGVEVLAKPGDLSSDKLNKRIDEIQAGGLTPLAKAIKKAAETLKPQDRKSKLIRKIVNTLKPQKNLPQIVLFTDGTETCGGNAEKEINLAQNQGIKVQIPKPKTRNFDWKIVAYGVNEEVEKELNKLADLGHGLFFNAEDPKQLEELTSQMLLLPEGVFKVKRPTKIDIKSWKVYEKTGSNPEEPVVSRREIKGNKNSLWERHDLPVGDYEIHIIVEKNQTLETKVIEFVIVENEVKTIKI